MLEPSTTGRALAAVALALLVACEAEPSLLCDRARVVWPFFEIDPSDDVDPGADGIQIDLVLRTSLLAGSAGYLTIAPAGGDPVTHPEVAAVDEGGELRFRGVTLPLGRVTLSLLVQNECGQASTSRTLFVWDGLGIPMCELALAPEPVEVEALAPAGVLRAEHDGDPDSPGVPVRVTVAAGRADMVVTLFALELATGVEQHLSAETGADRAAEYDLTLADGEHALRAVCHWPPEDLRPSSITRHLLVDTAPPACQLIEPTARVLPIDDLDPEEDGVQFTIRGRATAPDAAGRPGAFVVNGAEIAVVLDEAAEASATGTVPADPLAPQELAFRASDLAGNACEDAAIY